MHSEQSIGKFDRTGGRVRVRVAVNLKTPEPSRQGNVMVMRISNISFGQPAARLSQEPTLTHSVSCYRFMQTDCFAHALILGV